MADHAEDYAAAENLGHLRLVKNEPPKLPPYELDTEEQYPEPSEGHRHFEIVTCRDCGAYLGDVEP